MNWYICVIKHKVTFKVQVTFFTAVQFTVVKRKLANI